MSVRRIEHQNIDKVKWDQMPINPSENSIFCKSWYLDICAKKWDALVWGDYETAFPLPTSTKAGVTFLYLPFFVRQLNMIGATDDQKWQQLMSFLKTEFKRVDICLSNGANIELESRVHQILDLSIGYDNLRSAYSKNAKRLIKKCSGQNMTINEQASPENLVEQFKLETGHKIKDLQENQYKTLLTLMNHCLNDGKGRCVSIEIDGVIHGSAFFMENEGRVTFLKSFVSELGKKMGVSYLMMDRAIQYYSDQFKKFDFGGSKVESVAQFYKKFGAIDAFYLHLSFDNSPVYHKLIRGMKRKIKG